MQQQEGRRWLGPILLVFALLGAAQCAQQLPIGVLGPAMDLGQNEQTRIIAEQERLLAELIPWLELLYPVPRAVRIGEKPVPVHRDSSADSDVLALLSPPGASVLVDAHSVDGHWMHVSTPVGGWIQQGGVTHTFTPADGSVAHSVSVRPGIGEITATALRVRQRPLLDAPILGQLNAGEQVLILAATLEGDWLQIVEPIQGWVSSQYVFHNGSAADLLRMRSDQ